MGIVGKLNIYSTPGYYIDKNGKKIEERNWPKLNGSSEYFTNRTKLYLLPDAVFFNDMGIVESVSDGIVNIYGLTKVANGEMINFCVGSNRINGLILNLEFNRVSAIVLGSDRYIRPAVMFIENLN